MMKVFYFFVLVTLLLPLSACGEKISEANNRAAELPMQAKELTPEEKLAKLLKDAESGNADAQYMLGMAYRSGEGVTNFNYEAAFRALVPFDQVVAYIDQNYPGVIDASKSIEWFQKAAAQGHAKAQFRLGIAYAIGKDVPKDVNKAVGWYQKSAVQGYGPAQKKLGEMYFYGIGLPKDIAQAVELQEKAAAIGSLSDKFELGAINFKSGIGVPKDAVKAFKWVRQAAEGSYVDAYYIIGGMYAKGEGVPKNIESAFEWYLKAAAQGDQASQFIVSQMYESGEGVSRDLVRAYAWFNLEASKENDEIFVKSNRRARIDLEKQMTPAQRAEGERLASNWRKGDTLLATNSVSSGSTTNNDKPSKRSTGTAFAVSKVSHALTNHHVVVGCAELKIAGREGIVKVITSDSVNDLALLQLPGNSQDIANLNPEPGKLRQGEDIIVFGYPLEWALSSGGNLTPGIISALTGLGNNTNQIQITAPIQPGSSGSPVMDKKGNVVGVVSMKLDDGKMARATGQVGQNVNFAVNGQTVKAFLDANKVPYITGGGFFSREKSNADIAEEASKWTVLVECWR